MEISKQNVIGVLRPIPRRGITNGDTWTFKQRELCPTGNRLQEVAIQIGQSSSVWTKVVPRDLGQDENKNLQSTAGESLKQNGKNTYRKKSKGELHLLRTIFNQDPYPRKATKCELADITGLKYNQINNWFEYQRKKKKTNLKKINNIGLILQNRLRQKEILGSTYPLGLKIKSVSCAKYGIEFAC